MKHQPLSAPLNRIPMKPRETRRRRTSLGLLALLATCVCAPGFGQSAVTDPVGVVKTEIPASSLSLVGIPMINSNVLAGFTSSVDSAGAVVSVPTAIDFTTVIEVGKRYYLEVTNSPAFEGDRIEIDETQTRSGGTPNKVFFETSDLNTILPAALSGQSFSFALRLHVTLDQLASSGQWGAALRGGTNANNSDNIVLLGTSGFVTYWLRSSDNTWRRGFSNGGGDVIAPGTGFYLKRNSSESTSAVFVGSVRTNDFVVKILAGNQILALGYPLDSSPAMLAYLTPFATMTNGDSISTFSTGGFTTSTYRSSDNTWRRGFTNVTNQALVSTTAGYFLNSQAGDADFLQPMPFTL